MSLRTKLLVGVIGVPVAILMIALWMMVQWERRVDASLASAGRLMALARVASWTELGRAVLAEMETQRITQAYVMRWERPDRTYSAKDFWTAREYFDPATTRTTPADVYTDPIEGEEPTGSVQKRRLREFIYRGLHASEGSDESGSELVDGYLAIYPRSLTRGRRYAILVRVRTWRTGQSLYWIVVVGALLSALVGWILLTHLVTQPLAKLASTADAIAGGRTVKRARVKRHPDEFDRTIEALHRMSEEISEYHGHLEDRVMSALHRMRKAERHLAIAQRLAATGTLAAGLAHEINNPLGGMKNAVQALARGGLSPEKNEQYLGLVNDGLSRIEQMVKKFVAFAPRKVAPNAVDVVEVVTRALALTAHKVERRGIQLVHRLPPGGTAIVLGDSTELQQVALNLLLNAIDALKNRAQPRIVVSLTQRDDDWLLAVEDNGPGIDEADQERIFDMFFTTKAVGEGSGMGLAVAHAIVTNHGGRLELDCVPERGARFLVILPAHDRGRAEPRPPKRPAPAPPIP